MIMTHYLTFTFNNLIYGVEATSVQEVFFLPEIKPIPEGPSDIIGTVNLRGDIIPIMDLNLRFGYPPQDYQLNDSIVVLNHQELRLGIIANQVHAIRTIESQFITEELTYDHPFIDLKQDRFIAGYAQENEELNLLLNLGKLLRYVEESNLDLDLEADPFAESLAQETLIEVEFPPADAVAGEEPQTVTPAVKIPLFWPNASEYERKVLQKRADNLRQHLRLRDFTGLKPVSVFSLHQELFGIELSSIQEFIQFNKVTPIPCTPNFVLGNINLRGEVITLMDVRSFFNLPQSHRFQKEGRAIIVNVQGIVAGLLVDHIHDIFMLDPKQLVTDQTVETEINQDFCQGVLPYQDKMLAIIDLLPLVQGDRLLVDEAV